ncbi:MAG TPA: SAM-dependent methyltransferase [Acetobacteraceae bacterium]|jgi:cyclopropane-fatty-acyl-phospholipid synthase|nr:SAM-dependent methyltransferase [Acetobacteraceae bacterium]
MSLVTVATNVIERVPFPDAVTNAGISFLVDRTRRKLAREGGASDVDFARLMARHPIAVRPDAANAQHYEVKSEFFGLVLGPSRKYSCCFYQGNETLAQAEELALAETAAHAGLQDRQDILELGCGWGSLSLWMAEHYPNARITAVSNSHGQRAYIEARAAERGFSNLRIITADMNDFAIGDTFDRVVSVEMFEHMTNWQSLLGRIHGWLRPDGRLFLHVFSHHSAPYLFDIADKEDWIAQHFFTGGIMPSHGLIHHVADTFEVEADWRWNGEHYARTARDWLSNFDRNEPAVTDVLHQVYGADAGLWKRRWRLFFLATAGLFGHAGGSEWGVSHYRLRPRA